MTFSWMTQFIQVNNDYPAFFKIGIMISGSEIPSWFNNQSVGSSLPVSPVMQDKRNNVVGFLCCIVFSIAPYPPKVTRDSQWKRGICMTVYPTSLRPASHLLVVDNEDIISVKSNHIWLIYFPLESFSRAVFDHIRVEIISDDDLEFNSTTMLALKRKFLEIEDEAQPQPHSFR
ncbi:unnamed protein product [Lathyrus sativus]|nr:unnamed protein product [Lathyrus sativus]